MIPPIKKITGVGGIMTLRASLGSKDSKSIENKSVGLPSSWNLALDEIEPISSRQLIRHRKAQDFCETLDCSGKPVKSKFTCSSADKKIVPLPGDQFAVVSADKIEFKCSLTHQSNKTFTLQYDSKNTKVTELKVEQAKLSSDGSTLLVLLQQDITVGKFKMFSQVWMINLEMLQLMGCSFNTFIDAIGLTQQNQLAYVACESSGMFLLDFDWETQQFAQQASQVLEEDNITDLFVSPDFQQWVTLQEVLEGNTDIVHHDVKEAKEHTKITSKKIAEILDENQTKIVSGGNVIIFPDANDFGRCLTEFDFHTRQSKKLPIGTMALSHTHSYRMLPDGHLGIFLVSAGNAFFASLPIESALRYRKYCEEQFAKEREARVKAVSQLLAHGDSAGGGPLPLARLVVDMEFTFFGFSRHRHKAVQQMTLQPEKDAATKLVAS
jgi:hypothetical protein